jgi:hypothetical protein
MKLYNVKWWIMKTKNAFPIVLILKVIWHMKFWYSNKNAGTHPICVSKYYNIQNHIFHGRLQNENMWCKVQTIHFFITVVQKKSSVTIFIPNGTCYRIIPEENLGNKWFVFRGATWIQAGIFMRKSSNHSLSGHCRLTG